MYLARNYICDIVKLPYVIHLRLVIASFPRSGVMMGGKHGGQIQRLRWDEIEENQPNQTDCLHLGKLCLRGYFYVQSHPPNE
jgi:hypothetical protein